MSPRGTPKKRGNDRSAPGSLTPSDQLLAIFAVNLILLPWVAWSLSNFWEPTPHLPSWIYWAEGFVLFTSFLLASWPRIRAIAEGREDADPVPQVNISVLKGAVILFTGMDVVILWELAEATGGVLSPYVPFLPAPAIFASFVTKKWQTILGLSIAVVIAIAFSTLEIPDHPPDIYAYQGSAAVMVLLAGVLSALQVQVANTGQPITAPREEASSSGLVPPPDDDDDEDLPSPASP